MGYVGKRDTAYPEFPRTYSQPAENPIHPTWTTTYPDECSNNPPVVMTSHPYPGGGVFTGTGIVDPTGVFDSNVAGPGTHTITYTVNNDSITNTIVVNPAPSVSLTLQPYTTVFRYTPPFTMTGESPSGGTFSGTGVSGNTFTPGGVVNAPGVSISYTITDPTTNCSNVAYGNIICLDDAIGYLADYPGIGDAVNPLPPGGNPLIEPRFHDTNAWESLMVPIGKMGGTQMVNWTINAAGDAIYWDGGQWTWVIIGTWFAPNYYDRLFATSVPPNPITTAAQYKNGEISETVRYWNGIVWTTIVPPPGTGFDPMSPAPTAQWGPGSG